MCLKIKIEETRSISMYIDVFYFAIIINWTYFVVAFLNFLIFSLNIKACQKHALPWNRLEKLEEVFKNNFLTAM